MAQRISLVNTSGAPAFGVRIALVLTRSAVTEVRIAGLPEGVDLSEPVIGSRYIDLQWRPGLPSDHQIDVYIEKTGESLSKLHAEWLGAVEGFAFAAVRDADETFEARRAAIRLQSIDSRLRCFQQFFLEYDQGSNQKLIAKQCGDPLQLSRLIDLLDRTADLLTQRVLQRRWIADQNRVPRPGELPLPADTDDVRRLSTFQLALYRRHFGDPIETAKFTEAFMAFANGELRIQAPPDQWNSEPNSAFEFSFAEFALLAIELHVDESEWRSVLRTFVASQEVYMAVYKPQTPPFHYDDYRSTNFDLNAPLSEAAKDAIVARYAAFKTVEELALQMGVNLQNAFV